MKQYSRNDGSRSCPYLVSGSLSAVTLGPWSWKLILNLLPWEQHLDLDLLWLWLLFSQHGGLPRPRPHETQTLMRGSLIFVSWLPYRIQIILPLGISFRLSLVFLIPHSDFFNIRILLWYSVRLLKQLYLFLLLPLIIF